jgi:ribulose-phosphate 3-epimerase
MPARAVRIAPSLLAADLGRFAEQLATVEAAGADWLHVDVMDGVFVPNLTFGAKIIETCRRLTTLPLDVHLMVVEPEKYFESFAAAGAAAMTIHQEAVPHLHRQLARIRELGCRAGAAVNPGTPVETLRDVVPNLDLLLVMTVNPGFGGQKFIDATVDKIARARAMLDAAGSPAALEVDGGVTRDTIARCWQAGADTFVAGVAVFGAQDPAQEVRALRGRCGVAV